MSTQSHYTAHVATADLSLWRRLMAFLAPLFLFFGIHIDDKEAPSADSLTAEQVEQLWKNLPPDKRSLISLLDRATAALRYLYDEPREFQYRLPAGHTVPKDLEELATSILHKNLVPVRLQELPPPRYDRITGERLPDLPRSTSWLIETFDGRGEVKQRVVTESQLRKEVKALVRWLHRVRFNTKAKTVRPAYGRLQVSS